jgi:hypothetical protein
MILGSAIKLRINNMVEAYPSQLINPIMAPRVREEKRSVTAISSAFPRHARAMVMGIPTITAARSPVGAS